MAYHEFQVSQKQNWMSEHHSNSTLNSSGKLPPNGLGTKEGARLSQMVSYVSCSLPRMCSTSVSRTAIRSRVPRQALPRVPRPEAR